MTQEQEGGGRKGVREQEEESARARSPSEQQHVRESVLGEGDTAGAKPRIRETAALDGIGNWFRQLAHRQEAKFHDRQRHVVPSSSLAKNERGPRPCPCQTVHGHGPLDTPQPQADSEARRRGIGVTSSTDPSQDAA